MHKTELDHERVISRENTNIKLSMRGSLIALFIYTVVIALGGYYVGSFLSQMRRAQQPVSSNQREYIAATPSQTITETTSQWESYTVDELGLSFSAPPELEIGYNVEITEDTNTPYLLTLYIQNEVPGDEYYQLYGIIQWDLVVPESLDNYETELVEDSIEEVTIAGFPALKGQIQGERNRFVTYILLPDGVLSLFTAEPTEKNKELSNKIIDTFEFTE